MVPEKGPLNGCVCVCIYIVMDACLLFILFDLVFQYLTKILAAKKVSEMAFLCRVGHKTISQSIDQFCHLWFYCYEFLLFFAVFRILIIH